MARVTKTDFRGGLFVAGASEGPAAGTTLRRSLNTAPIKVQGIRSRLGSTRVGASVPAGQVHSVYRYNGRRYFGVGSTLYLDSGAGLKFGLTGLLWSFLRMPPQEGQQDWMFVAGAGGTPFKVSPSNVVRNWGIAAPPDGFTAALGTQRTHQIQSFNPGFAAGLVPVSIAGAAPVYADETLIIQEGTGSLKGIFARDSLAGFFTTGPFDLSTFTGGASSGDEDFIVLWVRIDNPTNVEYMSLQFDVSDGTFNTDYYQRTFTIEATTPLSSDKLRKQVFGLNDFLDPQAAQTVKDITKKETAVILDAIGQTSLSVQANVWTRLQVPKSVFFRVGAGSQTWANVAAFQILVKTAARGDVIIYFDDLNMLGGNGMQGDYQYLITYRNANTGNRSNANPTPVTVPQVWRQFVDLGSLPTSTDPQVTHVEVWRTIGNGALFFKAFEVTNGTGTATDAVADYYGLDTRPGAVVLGDDQLPTYNLDPLTACGNLKDAVGPWQERAWLISSTAGSRGRIFYSAAGLPEGIEGFITPSSDDDPFQKLVIWNNALFGFSNKRVFQVDGTTQPFTYREIFGAPGTTVGKSCAQSPYGIVYYVPKEGVRLFDGGISKLVGYQALGVLFRGEGSTDLPAGFSGFAGWYGRDDYYVRDLSGNVLVLSIDDGSWREIDVPIFSMYHEPDTEEWLAGLATKAVLWESPGALDDDGDPINFVIRTPMDFVDVADFGVLQFVFAEGVLNGQTLTTTLYYTDGITGVVSSLVLPPFVGTLRQQFEWIIGRSMRDVEIEIAGAVSAEVQLYRIEADIYVPGEVAEERGTAAQ